MHAALVCHPATAARRLGLPQFVLPRWASGATGLPQAAEARNAVRPPPSKSPADCACSCRFASASKPRPCVSPPAIGSPPKLPRLHRPNLNTPLPPAFASKACRRDASPALLPFDQVVELPHPVGPDPPPQLPTCCADDDGTNREMLHRQPGPAADRHSGPWRAECHGVGGCGWQCGDLRLGARPCCLIGSRTPPSHDRRQAKTPGAHRAEQPRSPQDAYPGRAIVDADAGKVG
jgi:hypothetical protein